MKDKLVKQWERLGEIDPYWAVLSDPDKMDNKWKLPEFFQSGETEMNYIFSKLSELNLEATIQVALDFGCGVGRLSRALAKKCPKVIAVDISGTMLNEAKRINQHLGNIKFIQNHSKDLSVIPSQSIDFLYSNIVLQHMYKKQQIIFIKEFCRVLKGRGILVFQAPSSCVLRNWKCWIYMLSTTQMLNLMRRIKYGRDRIMEIHTLGRKIITKILEQEDMSIIHIERYDSTGSEFEGYMYYAQKK